MTLRTRLALGLLAIGVVLSLPLAYASRSLRDVYALMNGLRGQEFTASLHLGRLRGYADEVRRAEEQLVVVSPDSLPPADWMQPAVTQISAAADSLRRFGLYESATAIQSAVARASMYASRERDATLEKQTRHADAISDSARAAITSVDSIIRVAERELTVRTAKAVNTAANQTGSTQDVAVAAFAIAALVATLAGAWLVRSISRPVRDLEFGMQAVANGEFGHRLQIAADRNDEFGRLAASYESMSIQLAELDKLKAEFVSVASHELKTPINVIGGYLQLLEEGVYGPLTGKQQEVCNTIAAQCDSLARLVRQLLDVSRFEAGGGKIEPRRFVFGQFLNELERAFQVLAMQRGVRFRLVRGVGLPDEVTWDPDRINEVLGNMLSNAFKFTPRDGSVDLMAEADDDLVQLTVRDTGAGIPPAQLPHIFKKFYQADNQASAAVKGTGLGLAISKGIVDAHGGSIGVDSTLGVGTTFTILLPEHVRSRRSAAQRIVAAVGG